MDTQTNTLGEELQIIKPPRFTSSSCFVPENVFEGLEEWNVTRYHLCSE